MKKPDEPPQAGKPALPASADPKTLRRARSEKRAGGPKFAKMKFLIRLRRTAPLVIDESEAFHRAYTLAAAAKASGRLHPLKLSIDFMRDAMKQCSVSHPSVNVDHLSDRLFAQHARQAGCPVTGDRREVEDELPSHPEIAHFVLEFQGGKSSIFLHAAVSVEDGLFFFDLSRDLEPGMESLLLKVAQCYGKGRFPQLRLLAADPAKWLKEEAFLTFLERFPEKQSMSCLIEELTPEAPVFSHVSLLRSLLETMVADVIARQMKRRAERGPGVFLLNEGHIVEIETLLRRVGRRILASKQLDDERWMRPADR